MGTQGAGGARSQCGAAVRRKERSSISGLGAPRSPTQTCDRAEESEATWHGTKLNSPGWRDQDGRALGLTIAGFDGDDGVHIMLNMYWESLDFELLSVPGRIWLKAVDTSQPAPLDTADFRDEHPVAGNVYRAQGRSVAVLVNRVR